MAHPSDDEMEAVTLCAATCLLLDGRFVREADYRALSAERDALKQSLEKAVLACGEQARARGGAEGRLAASEMAGVVDGWKARAESAQANADYWHQESRIQFEAKNKAREERDEAVQLLICMVNHATWREENEGVFWEATEKSRAFLARHQKEADQ